MTKPDRQRMAARQIERILRQAGGISTLPEIAAELLTLLAEPACDRQRMAGIIQTDSALSANIISQAAQQNISFAGGRPTIAEAAARLPREALREVILSAKVFPTLNWAAENDSRRLLPRRQLALHSLAAACCAEALAHFVLPPEQRQAAYLAGLLHDIGKSALDETMPKSFERLVRQARDTGQELCDVEQAQLGLDHASLGKRLAEKWQLPEAITACIWLHHTDPQSVAALQAEPLLPAVVALADRLARLSAIGQSGTYADPSDTQEWVRFLGLTDEQVRQVREELPLNVTRQCQMIQWTPREGAGAYAAAVQQTAVGLARDNRQLGQQSRSTTAMSGQNDLIDAFLDDISAYSGPIEVAEQFALFWQKQHACGTTAVVVLGDAVDVPEASLEMVTAARDGKTSVAAVRPPGDRPVVPEAFENEFGIAAVSRVAPWLLEAIDADMNPPQMRIAPLAVKDKVAGLLAFELTEPTEPDARHCATACRTAAFAMTMAMNIQKHDELSDRFVHVLGALRRTRTELAKTASMQGLAEMAAGAAHELNNPLAVISGRVQLLMTDEQDDTKTQMLGQIQQRTEEVSQIIADLMSFARPPQPEKRPVSLGELIDKAAEKTCARHAFGSLELEATVQRDESLYVDAHQVAEALSHIFSNAVQSYPGQNGPIWIESRPQDGQNAVQLTIRDAGCGMDSDTQHKAAEPFFSHCPAGRRRGMGLAHARRLLQLNDAILRLESVPDEGTTVFVQLPKA